MAPCAVFFDATRTRDPDTDRAFHRLRYEWDFGDERGEIWEHSGRAKNRAIGAIAGHVYEWPGDHVAVLVVTDPKGTASRRQVKISVADPDQVFPGKRTRCVSASGDFSGCPSGAETLHSSDFDGSLLDLDGRRTLFRRGESFTFDRSIQLTDASRSGASIGVFGNGSEGALVRARESAGIDAGNDWRVYGLRFEGHGLPLDRAAFSERNGVQRFTLLDVAVRGFGACLSFWSPTAPDAEVAVVDFSCRDFPDPGKGTQLFEDTERSFFQGLDLDRGELRHPADQSEFAHRSAFLNRKLIQHSLYRGRAANQSKNALQLRHCQPAPPWTRCRDGEVPGRYVLVSDNQFVEGGGPQGLTVVRVCDHAGCGGTPGDSQPVQDLIFERNLIQVDSRGPEDRLQSVFMLQGARVTIRNNLLDLQGWPGRDGLNISMLAVMPPSNAARDPADGFEFSHNTVYTGEGMPGSIILCNNGGGGSGHVCANNLVYAPGLRGDRIPTRGIGWKHFGNRFAGESENPFSGPPGRAQASLRDLSGFLPKRPCHSAAEAEVGAHELGAHACNASEPSPSAPAIR